MLPYSGIQEQSPRTVASETGTLVGKGVLGWLDLGWRHMQYKSQNVQRELLRRTTESNPCILRYWILL